MTKSKAFHASRFGPKQPVQPGDQPVDGYTLSWDEGYRLYY
jgi:hypothetical protein